MPGNLCNRFLLLYGSQTGQAKAIAEEIFERASAHNLHPDIHCLSMTDKKFSIENEKCVVIVTSTTGDGDPPDTALKFVRRLNKKTLPDDFLSKLHYTILGLGDTNYSNFCNNPKNIDRRLSQLSGQRFYPCGYADEAVGLEVVVDPWIEGLFPALQAFLQQESKDSDSSQTLTVSSQNETLMNGVVDKLGQKRPDASQSLHNAENKAGLDVLKAQSLSDISQSPLIQNSSGSIDSGQSPSGYQTESNHEERTSIPVSEELTDAKGEEVKIILEETSDSSYHRQASDTSDSALQEIVVGDGGGEFLQLNKPIGDAPCLRASVLPLSGSPLTLPAVTPAYLTITYLPPDQDLPRKLAELPWQNGCKAPSAASEIVKAKIVSAQRLTAEDAVKKTLLLRLNIEDSRLKYSPGDSISVICANNGREVSQLIERLGLASVADFPLQLSIMADTKKRRAVVPPHIPEEGASLRYIFRNCVDIREPPKKALLRLLVDYTSDESEKRRLQELCSKEGAEEYGTFLRAENVSLLDVLYTFTSCKPPVERLIEHIPRLQPRPYSACSCQDWHAGHLDIVFNVVEIPASGSRLYSRRGLCTGWLDDITLPLQLHKKVDELDSIELCLTMQLEFLSLSSLEVKLFSRTNQNFHPPDDLSLPLILIGPGTGVAPYIGFLQERQLRMERKGTDTAVGESWLLFGCRYENKDFLFKSEIKFFQEKGVLTRFLLVFSRDQQNNEDTPRYVQDSIRAHSSEIFHLIHNKQAVVFVCGDAKNMAKNVNAAFEDLMQKHGMSEDESRTYVMKMRIHRHYLEDVWT